MLQSFSMGISCSWSYMWVSLIEVAGWIITHNIILLVLNLAFVKILKVTLILFDHLLLLILDVGADLLVIGISTLYGLRTVECFISFYYILVQCGFYNKVSLYYSLLYFAQPVSNVISQLLKKIILYVLQLKITLIFSH